MAKCSPLSRWAGRSPRGSGSLLQDHERDGEYRRAGAAQLLPVLMNSVALDGHMQTSIFLRAPLRSGHKAHFWNMSL